MGLFDGLEQRLERGVKGAFARVFRSEVEPVELAAGVRGAMDQRAAILSKGRTIVPNLFTIELSKGDYERLSTLDQQDLKDELIAAAEEHAESQRYIPGGPIRVIFSRQDELETGVFRIRPSTARHPEELIDDYDNSGAYAAQPAQRHTPPPSPVGEGDHLPATQMQQAVEPPQPKKVNLRDRPWLDVDGERYPLIGAITVLGRDDSADVILDDPGISRRHSELRVTHDGPHVVATLRDLGSTNGTFVNSERISGPTHLSNGDRITVGRTTVTYRGGRK
ncbi:MAG: DUF3662 and FHA domain-containing protein [Micrococcales bacterium]|nr:DUF3662 and FHA domain-containing protein [Micrococcales bacterium]